MPHLLSNWGTLYEDCGQGYAFVVPGLIFPLRLGLGLIDLGLVDLDLIDLSLHSVGMVTAPCGLDWVGLGGFATRCLFHPVSAYLIFLLVLRGQRMCCQLKTEAPSFLHKESLD